MISIVDDLKVDLTAPNGKQFTLPTGLFINNEFVKATSGQKLTSINPSDEKEIASVESASADDVDRAVKAARKAFNGSWRDVAPTTRGQMMYKLTELMQREIEVLATIETWDNGKPFAKARGDVQDSISCIRYYAGYADKIHGQTIPTTGKKFAYTLRLPLGVCAAVIPWNYPLLMAAWKLGPSLACGNTVVMKPSEATPLSILYLATLIPEAGFPPGVINIVNGDGREAGNALASHMDVDKIAFTGSTATGKAIMRAAAANLKSVTMETGGKSPLLVFEDANVEQAAKWAQQGIMENMGQVCTATSRLLVHENVYDEFIEQFKTAVNSVSKVGNPFDEGTSHGPQVNKSQYERIMAYVDAGKNEGATLVAGGTANKSIGEGKGYFIDPTIFTGVTSGMKIYREEVFGPFVVITKFRDEAEAIAMANDTEYGLGSSVFTRDIERAHRVASKLDAGMTWVNSSNDADFRVPFGGTKASGFGRELGEAGLAAYTFVKSIQVNMGNIK